MLENEARRALARHGYRGPEARLTHVQLRDALVREIAELEGRVSWWDRIVFFSDTPDEARLEEATGQLEAVDAELAALTEADDRALAAAGAEMPALRVVLRVGQAYRWFQSTLAHDGDDHEATAKVLDALAVDVRTTYLAGVDVDREIEQLAARLEQAAPATDASPPPRPAGPIALYLAATAASAILTGVEIPERNFQAYGMLVSRRTGHIGLAAYALSQLLEATDESFPGLLAFATGILVTRSRLRRTGGAAQPPYRTQAARAEEARPPMRGPDAEGELFAKLDEEGISRWLARGVDHAVVAGARRRARGRAESARAHSESTVSVAQHACAMVSRAGSSSFEIALRDLLLDAHVRIETVRMGVVGLNHGTGELYDLGPAVDAVDRLLSFLGRSLGIGGTRHALAEAVFEHLERSPPVRPPYAPGQTPQLLCWSDLVVTLAEALRPTTFAASYAELRAATNELWALVPRADEAKRAIPLLDRVNFLTESAAERERKAIEQRGNQLRLVLLRTGPAIEAQLDQALQFYPPVALYYRLTTVRSLTAQIRAELRRDFEGRSFWQLVGKDEAAWALSLWNRAVSSTIGIAPSNGILLARYAMRDISG